MEIILGALAGSAACELLAVWTAAMLRRLMAGAALVMTVVAAVGLVLVGRNMAAVLVAVLSLYRAINVLRLLEARIHPRYLRRAASTTAGWLLGLQALVLVIWYVGGGWPMSVWLYGVVGLQVGMATVLLSSTLRHLRTTRFRADNAEHIDKNLPAVTVAVPARNEDGQLEDCLRSILASDYPKLEVIVLDDCSQDRTPDIIRSFAHDGVRFVPGDEPRPNWLAKNQAYDRLAQAASGDMVLFSGVDVRFAPPTIRYLVETLLAKRKTMLSVMPRNIQTGPSWPQSMRYMWELALPRRLFNRPPVLSSCWLITRAELQGSGGFAAVARAITPEAYFARRSAEHDGYTFLHSDPQLGMTSTKSLIEQRQTAIRTRYPQLHRRPELTALVSVAELGLLASPMLLAAAGFWHALSWTFALPALCASLLLFTAYGRLCLALFSRRPWLIVPCLPLAVLYDVVLLHYSMWKYEFSTVMWKDRNVCIPVMRAGTTVSELRDKS